VRRAALALAGALLAAGCAADRVTLLDNEDGEQQFAVADITNPDKERVLDAQLSELKLGRSSGPRALRKLRESDAQLLTGLPPKAREFVIIFPAGESKIPQDQRKILEDIRNELSVRPGAQIEVAGFTDSQDTDEKNDRLSLGRAQSVAQELRDFGFPVDPGDAVGRGEDEAKKRFGDDKEVPEYRRAVVIVR